MDAPSRLEVQRHGSPSLEEPAGANESVFRVSVSLAPLPVASLPAALVGLAHEFPREGLAPVCFQYFSAASLAAALAASILLIHVFMCVCAAAAWTVALAFLESFGAVFSSVQESVELVDCWLASGAGTAASFVLIQVSICVSATATTVFSDYVCSIA